MELLYLHPNVHVCTFYAHFPEVCNEIILRFIPYLFTSTLSLLVLSEKKTPRVFISIFILLYPTIFLNLNRDSLLAVFVNATPY